MCFIYFFVFFKKLDIFLVQDLVFFLKFFIFNFGFLQFFYLFFEFLIPKQFSFL